jgi:signal transduction histidine kinase
VLVPTAALYGYETFRHALLDAVLPTLWGNLLAGVLALSLAYIFSELVFHTIERLQQATARRDLELARLNAVTEERERLSRELHDGLAQVIAYLLVRLDTVEGLVSDGRSAEATAELERLHQVADDLYVEVRDAIRGLRSPVLAAGLAAALADYVGAFADHPAVATHLTIGDLPAPVPPAVEQQLFRITQEALANVRRHARAQHVWVTLTGDSTARDHQIRLTIADDGDGFDPVPPDSAPSPLRSSYGLATMRERAQSLGGTLQVNSEPGRGTRIQVTVPL